MYLQQQLVINQHDIFTMKIIIRNNIVDFYSNSYYNLLTHREMEWS